MAASLTVNKALQVLTSKFSTLQLARFKPRSCLVGKFQFLRLRLRARAPIDSVLSSYSVILTHVVVICIIKKFNMFISEYLSNLAASH